MSGAHATTRGSVAWWRLWSVQGSFESGGQQWTGWLVCLAPWLRARARSASIEDWLATEPATLNTNPYLFGLLVGVRQTVEEEHGRDTARRVTQALQSVLGALGDALVWTAWRPAAALLAGLLGLLAGWPGPVGVWLAFAAAQGWLRGWAWRWGRREGIAAVSSLESLGLRRWTERGRVYGASIAGALAATVVVATWRATEADPAAIRWTTSILAPGVGALVAWRRGRGEQVIVALALLLWIAARVGVVRG